MHKNKAKSSKGSANFRDESKRLSHAFIGASFGWLVISSDSNLPSVLLLGCTFIFMLCIALASIFCTQKFNSFYWYFIPAIFIYVALTALVARYYFMEMEILNVSGEIVKEVVLDANGQQIVENEVPRTSKSTISFEIPSVRNTLIAVLLTYIGYITTILFPAPISIKFKKSDD